MASRRLKSDRFFTEDFRPEVYTPFGIDWLNKETMQSMMERHYPALKGRIPSDKNTFAPGNEGRTCSRRVARASLLDSLRFNLVSRHSDGASGRLQEAARSGCGCLVACTRTRLGERFVARIRAKYHTPFVDLLMLTQRTRLVARCGGNPARSGTLAGSLRGSEVEARRDVGLSAERGDDLADAAVGRAAVVQRSGPRGRRLGAAR